MSIDQRQFEQLSEMGIKLWRRRDNPEHLSTTKPNPNNYQKINLDSLINNQCFTDILLALNLTRGEVTQQADHLDLGLFNWYFLESKNKGELNITYLNKQLITPTMHLISQSVKLKRQLWQTISQQLT